MRVHNWKDAIPFYAPEQTAPVLDCDEAVVKCLYIDPGQEAKPHRHAGCVDVMVIVQGSALATVDGQPRRVGPGDVILNPRGTLHGLRNDGNERVVWVLVQSPPPSRCAARSSG